MNITMILSQSPRFQLSFRSQTSTLLTLVIKNLIKHVESAYRLNNLLLKMQTKLIRSFRTRRIAQIEKNIPKLLFSCLAPVRASLGWFMTIVLNFGLNFGYNQK